jgi:EcsC protein family
LAIDLIRRKALQAVPFAGPVIAASFNAAYMNDVARAAYMCYRRRWIDDHGADVSAP